LTIRSSTIGDCKERRGKLKLKKPFGWVGYPSAGDKDTPKKSSIPVPGRNGKLKQKEPKMRGHELADIGLVMGNKPGGGNGGDGGEIEMAQRGGGIRIPRASRQAYWKKAEHGSEKKKTKLRGGRPINHGIQGKIQETIRLKTSLNERKRQKKEFTANKGKTEVTLPIKNEMGGQTERGPRGGRTVGQGSHRRAGGLGPRRGKRT